MWTNVPHYKEVHSSRFYSPSVLAKICANSAKTMHLKCTQSYTLEHLQLPPSHISIWFHWQLIQADLRHSGKAHEQHPATLPLKPMSLVRQAWIHLAHLCSKEIQKSMWKAERITLIFWLRFLRMQCVTTSTHFSI